VALAEPVLRKYRLKLGIENHKGWRAAEQAAWLQRLSSEWVGVHFDFGNNLSLCEDPEETFRILSPYAIACHIKDMAVEPYEDGFLLSEVPLGDGILDLARWVAALRQRDPRIPFDVETITRDPLKIRCSPRNTGRHSTILTARCPAAIWRGCSKSCTGIRRKSRCRVLRA